MNVVLKQIMVLPTLMMWREEVIRHVFGCLPSKRLLVANRQYYRKHIADGSHYAIVASVDGYDCGCGAVCFTDELPSPDNPTGKCAYLMNIYVREAFRHMGIAHTLVKKLIAESLSRNCGKIYLETTDEARSVYKSLGFDELPGIMKLHDKQD